VFGDPSAVGRGAMGPVTRSRMTMVAGSMFTSEGPTLAQPG
jgi:hypothetical protein